MLKEKRNEIMNEFFKNLPRKYTGSGALFFDADSKVLMVKPTYKEGWEVPGGLGEENESPTGSEIAKITLPKKELSEYRFVSFDEVASLLTDNLGRRVLASIAAKKMGQTFYLEHGCIV